MSEDEESFDNTCSKALPVSSVERKKEKLRKAEKGFARDNDVAADVDPKVAKTVNKRLSIAVDFKSETNRQLLEKYNRPANYEY